MIETFAKLEPSSPLSAIVVVSMTMIVQNPVRHSPDEFEKWCTFGGFVFADLSPPSPHFVWPEVSGRNHLETLHRVSSIELRFCLFCNQFPWSCSL
jgi:hypothetical protein